MSVSFNSSQFFQMNNPSPTPLRGCAFQPPAPPFARPGSMPWFPQPPARGPFDFGGRSAFNRPPIFSNQGSSNNFSSGFWNNGGFSNGSTGLPAPAAGNNYSSGFWNNGSYFNGAGGLSDSAAGNNYSSGFWNNGGYYNGSSGLSDPAAGNQFPSGAWNLGGFPNGSTALPGLGDGSNFPSGSWNPGSFSDGSTGLPSPGGSNNFSSGSWNNGGYFNSSTGLSDSAAGNNFSSGFWNNGGYFNNSMQPGNGNGASNISAGYWNQGQYFNGSTSPVAPNSPQQQWSDTGVNDKKSSIDLGDYKMDLDKSDSSLTLTDAKTGNQTKVWGDPHIDFDANTGAKKSTMVDGPISFSLPGDKQVFVGTQPSGSNGPSFASDVYVVQGDRAYEVHGLNQNDANTPLSVQYAPSGGSAVAQQAPRGANNYIATPGGMLDASTNKPARDSIA
ncbi:DUF1521 domain-containing protein [Paraburkholderia sacchari]|uniref:DUF1521 domain-containing protein n=1 Tax=Paraburkholderia sacchari TaxID=159450 RepID=UPI000544351B|nr:DUF1521 domain-containing protein [Paraburkholderia sacchari]NLP65820.1 DUF1521 domain-containing protein [Paraburkholderia sacchari]